MTAISARSDRRPAVLALGIEILDRIAAYEDNPGLASDAIARRVRELSGAALVGVALVAAAHGPGGFRLVGASPGRDRARLEAADFGLLARVAASAESAAAWDERSCPIEGRDALCAAGWAPAVAAPIRLLGTPIGALVALRLPGPSAFDELLPALDGLEPFFAHALREARNASIRDEAVSDLSRLRTADLERELESLRSLERRRPVAMFHTDAEGRLTWADERVLAAVGRPIGELLGRRISELPLPLSGKGNCGFEEERDDAGRLVGYFGGLAVGGAGREAAASSTSAAGAEQRRD